MRWSLPNLLTISRLLAAPGFALAFVLLPRPLADWVALVLFVGASVTDWLDGHLARSWKQESRFGAMLDPIADKAMVVIALAVVSALVGPTWWAIIPIAVILFREVFVSGLREYLGNTAGTLKVTPLAKWKTTAQMLAVALLLLWGVFEHSFVEATIGMSDEIVGRILSGDTADELGLVWRYRGMNWAFWGGLALLWAAAALTLATGIDYFRKAMPHLQEAPDD